MDFLKKLTKVGNPTTLGNPPQHLTTNDILYASKEIMLKARQWVKLNRFTLIAYDWDHGEDNDSIEDCWLEWTVFEFAASDVGEEMGGENYRMRVVVHGCGPTGLRELRHTYFPDDGDVFYLKMDTMRLVFDELSKYYDGN
jgi:hypothetical protein